MVELVWFSLAIPKHSLNLWLATKGSLSIGDGILIKMSSERGNQVYVL
jgi:hypothetical protein